MKYFERALQSEILKTRHTLSVWLAFIAPFVVEFITFCAAMRMGGPNGLFDNPWQSIMQSIIMLWTLLAVPLFTTLQMGLQGALEHNNKGWKMLYALPIPRWAIYAAKQVVGMGLMALSTVALGVFTILNGLLINAVMPNYGMYFSNIPWDFLARTCMLSFLASWLIISIHLYISLRWPSFVLAMAVGIAATVAAVMVISSDFNAYYPWTLPMFVCAQPEMKIIQLLPQLLAGSLGGIVVALLGCWDVSRQDAL